MAAVRIHFGALARQRWRAWLAVSLLTGVLAAVVIAAAAGSKRTDGAYRRYLASIHGADVYVDPFVFGHRESLPLDGVARLPGVAETERSVQIAVVARGRDGRPVLPVGPDSLGWVLPTDGRSRENIDRLKLLRGRFPDPRRAGEVIGDTKALRILGVDVGDRLRVRTITQHSLDTQMIHLTADPRRVNWGPLVQLHVVGVAANARADVDGGQMHLTPAFYDRYGRRRIGAFIGELEVRLTRGAAGLPAFRNRLAAFARKRPFLLFEPNAEQPKIQHSIDLQSHALWLATVIGAIAVLVLVAQTLLRLAVDESRDDATLRALGADARHQLAIAALRGCVIALPAALVAVAVAFAMSPLAPIGWARELDPSLGVKFDASVLLPGAAIVLATVLLVGLAAGVRGLLAGDSRTANGPEIDAAPAPRLLRGRGSPAFNAGIEMALGVGSRRAARGTIAAAVAAIAITVTAATFVASMRHLTSTPRLYGQTWDYETFAGAPLSDKLVRAIVRDRGLQAVAGGTDDTISLNGVDTGVRAWDNLRGTIAPELIRGRAPQALGEVVLAPKTLDATHARVGSTVVAHSGKRRRRLQVVGVGVLPSSKFNKLGYGAITTFGTLKTIHPAATRALLLMRFAPGPTAAVRKRLDLYFDGNVVIKPDEVGDFGRIDRLPFYIAALAIAGACAALAHALVTRVRRSRHDLAILKTLGFTRGQVAAAVAWQASAIVAIAVLIGVPLGIGLGRFAWQLFADDLGVASEVVVPVLVAFVWVPAAALVLANLLALAPGWLAARVRPALTLRTE
jgi:ABC-type lipoprotein release transport system permease subunit